MTDKELGPASQVLLDLVNETPRYIPIRETLAEASRRTNSYYGNAWWWRRLFALALEGRIVAVITRYGDNLAFRFRRKGAEARWIEAVKGFVLSRRDDIEKDIENFGMLKPVLNYFLKEAEGDG